MARVELLGTQSGPDLIADAQTQPADAETGQVPDPALQSSMLNFVFGAMVRVAHNLDVGVRFQPSAPLLGRVKYQFYGVSESDAKKGSFSVSGLGSAGLLIGSASSTAATTSTHAAASGNAMLYTFQGAVIGGYRLGERHLVSLAPFLALAGLSGTGATEGSGFRYGLSLGYQYQIESLFFRADATYALGSFNVPAGTRNAGGIFPGAVFGFRL